MKPIANEPEALTKRREKQVLDSSRTEIELLHLRQESQEEKYKGKDDKIAEEINRLTSGQRRIALQKLWNDDCQRNENISQKRWENRNAAWFVKYEETFRKNHENKSPFIKRTDSTEVPQTYAAVVSIINKDHPYDNQPLQYLYNRPKGPR